MEEEIESSFRSQKGAGNTDNQHGLFPHFSSFALL